VVTLGVNLCLTQSSRHVIIRITIITPHTVDSNLGVSLTRTLGKHVSLNERTVHWY